MTLEEGDYVIEAKGPLLNGQPERELAFVAPEWDSRQGVTVQSDPDGDWDVVTLQESYRVIGRIDLDKLTIEPMDDTNAPVSPVCTCMNCAVCKGEKVICGSCHMCTRCHDHRPGCAGCPAEDVKEL